MRDHDNWLPRPRSLAQGLVSRAKAPEAQSLPPLPMPCGACLRPGLWGGQAPVGRYGEVLSSRALGKLSGKGGDKGKSQNQGLGQMEP